MEKKLKNLESSLNEPQIRDQYLECKDQLETIYTKKANGIKIRSKCNWYENGEKSTKFF